MLYNKNLLDQLSALSREGGLAILVWISRNEETLLEDLINTFKAYQSDIEDIIYELESKGLLNSYFENGHKKLVANNQKIINLLDIFSKSLLKNYEAIDLTS